MANGILASVLVDSLQKEIYTAPATEACTVVVTIVSKDNTPVTAQVYALPSSGTSLDDDYLISPTFTISTEPRTYTGLVLENGQTLAVKVGTVDELVVSVNGLEGQI